MVINKQEHKDILLEMIKQSQFPGHLLDLAFELKQAVLSAQITDSQESSHDKSI